MKKLARKLNWLTIAGGLLLFTGLVSCVGGEETGSVFLQFIGAICFAMGRAGANPIPKEDGSVDKIE